MQLNTKLIKTLEEIVYGKRRGISACFIRCILGLLSFLYRIVIKLYMLPFEIGIRKKQHIAAPVISIGNITVGGTGKTSVVKYICRGLADRGWKPSILSYGYGGKLEDDYGVVSDRKAVFLEPCTAGDEPVMLARDLPGIPVLVSRHRHLTGRAAITDLGTDVLVLDDGFQVWKLHRDLDIVLIDSSNPFDNRQTLPAGRLREPLSALLRADCIVTTGGCMPEERESTLSSLRLLVPDVPIYQARIVPRKIKFPADDTSAEPSWLQGRKIMALSSIGNPLSFERTLTELGAEIVANEPYPDHHAYSARDVRHICASADSSLVEYIVTTEKDFVKLKEFAFDTPLAVLGIDYSLDDENSFWELLGDRLCQVLSREEVSQETF